MHNKDHWEQVYAKTPADAVSWFQLHADQSVGLIQDTGLPPSAAIIDIGGGASMLADDLLAQGYQNLSVLDLSGAALASAQRRLGAAAQRVRWLEGDITEIALPEQAYDLWHDRAVFHFLTTARQRQAYVDAVLRAVKPGGHVIVATFAEDGPTQCSGLPVLRYSPDGLHAEFGAPFSLLRHVEEEHRTPRGGVQKFIYCYCRKSAP
jgi:ubiquinone/menaquinone biosynthesis C-methylase UbiE